MGDFYVSGGACVERLGARADMRGVGNIVRALVKPSVEQTIEGRWAALHIGMMAQPKARLSAGGMRHHPLREERYQGLTGASWRLGTGLH